MHVITVKELREHAGLLVLAFDTFPDERTTGNARLRSITRIQAYFSMLDVYWPIERPWFRVPGRDLAYTYGTSQAWNGPEAS